MDRHVVISERMYAIYLARRVKRAALRGEMFRGYPVNAVATLWRLDRLACTADLAIDPKLHCNSI